MSGIGRFPPLVECLDSGPRLINTVNSDLSDRARIAVSPSVQPSIGESMTQSPQPRDRLSTVLAIVSVCCAVVVTALLALRFSATPSERRIDPTPPPDEKISGWDTLRLVGHRRGPDSARVEIVMFSDFECPACRRFVQRALAGAVHRYPGDVAMIFRHWPLTYHRFALPAAKAAECAALQNAFGPYHDELFALQDSLGLVSFASVGGRTGVPDSAAFARCVDENRTFEAIERDTRAAQALGGSGTPTIIVNGIKLGAVPDSTSFDRLVQRILQSDRQ